MHTLPQWEWPRTARPPAPRGLGLRELPLSRVVVQVRNHTRPTLLEPGPLRGAPRHPAPARRSASLPGAPRPGQASAAGQHTAGKWGAHLRPALLGPGPHRGAPRHPTPARRSASLSGAPRAEQASAAGSAHCEYVYTNPLASGREQRHHACGPLQPIRPREAATGPDGRRGSRPRTHNWMARFEKNLLHLHHKISRIEKKFSGLAGFNLF